MSAPQKISPRDLETLLQDLEDGTATIAQRDSLMVLLENSQEIRRAYCEHMLLSSALHSEAIDREKFSELGEFGIARGFNHKRQIRYALAAAAGVMLAIGLALSFFAVKPPPVASVEASTGAQWEFASGGIAADRDFLPGTVLRVDEGVVRLDFSSGTEVFVQAPSEIAVDDRRNLTLRKGAVWVELAKSDKGFTVKTNKLRAIDLGTVFGVLRDKQGDQVHVESGEVRVESLLPQQKPVTLTASSAVGTDAFGYLKSTGYDSGLFRRDVRNLPKVVRWSFDGPDPMTADSNQGSRPRLDVFSVRNGQREPVFSQGPVGNALDLRKSVFAESVYQGVLGDSARTLAFWFRIEDREKVSPYGVVHPPLIKWGDESTAGASWKVSAGFQDGENFSTSWGGSSKGSKCGQFDPFNGQWHHFASVFTGGTIEGDSPDILHYMDGERIAITKSHTGSQVNTESPASPRQLVIGLFYHKGKEPLPLSLEIDELVIANRVLPEVVIKEMAAGQNLSAARLAKEAEGR